MSEHPPRAGGASLDVLRFLAAGFILLFHFGASAPRNLHDLVPVLGQGWLATDFFLLLSGFILMRAYGPRLAAGRVNAPHFVVRRVMRLWPSHLVALILMWGAVTLATLQGHPPDHAEKYGAVAFWQEAFLIHGWGLSDTPAWNVPTWTLSALVVCYVLFSLYAGHVYSWSRRCLWLGLVFVLVAGEGLAALSGQTFVDLPFRWGLLRAIPLFLAGSLLERLTEGLRVTPRTYAAGLIGCLGGVLVLGSLPRHPATDLLLLGGLAAVLCLSAGVALPESRVTRRLGRASYSLFLTHSLIGAVALGIDGMLVHRFGLSEPSHWLVWSMSVIAAVLFALIFEAFVDRPLSERVTLWLNRRRTVVA
ncbi:MAG: acyltransferase [Asticcacaulis sp.]